MDMKKKLDQAYMPDKAARAEKIVVALSGGLDSYVTAYLLKIQKHELIGVTAVTGWDDFSGDEETTLSCVVNAARLAKIKEFCHQIGIPHFTIKITAEFKENVVEPWLADRAFGTEPNPCWSCHELRFRALYDKMKELGAKHLATGHFAKLFHNEAHGTTFVHSSNDEQYDQSLLLARFPQEVLRCLMLPLSDLQKKEVLKLAENFGLSGTEKKLQMHKCFPWDEKTQEYVQKKLPPRFIKGGEVISLEDDSGVAEHEGVFPHLYGELMKAKGTNIKDDLFFVKYVHPEKKILVAESSYFQRKRVLLTDCEVASETPWFEPFRGSLKISQDLSVDCWVHPKTLRSALIEWEEPVILKEGEMIGVFRRKGKNSKVFLTGKIHFLLEEKEPEDGEKKHVKVDHTIDY